VIERRNLAHVEDIDRASTKTKQELQDAWKGVRKAKQEAIKEWARKTSKAIRVTIMAKNPKLAWRQVRVLEAGLTGHHKKPRTKRCIDEIGTKAANDSEDADNASNHSQKVCNRDDAPVDFSVLHSIEQRDAITELERKPEMEELIRAVKVMRGKVAPGKSGAVGRCLKHCLAEALQSTLEALTKFWGAEQDNPQSSASCAKEKGSKAI
jgi:hypothetical protein